MSANKGIKRKRSKEQRDEELAPIEKAIQESRLKQCRLDKPKEHAILLFSKSMMRPEKADFNKLWKILCEKTVRFILYLSDTKIY